MVLVTWGSPHWHGTGALQGPVPLVVVTNSQTSVHASCCPQDAWGDGRMGSGGLQTLLTLDGGTDTIQCR